jgi:hypothetical protein
MLLKFLVIKTVDRDQDRCIQPKMPDPDPHQMDTDPKHWFIVLFLLSLPTQGGDEDAGGPALSLHQHNSSALSHSLAHLHRTPEGTRELMRNEAIVQG